MKRLAVLLGLAVGLAACGQPGSATGGKDASRQHVAQQGGSRTVTVDLEDNGRRITLHTGDRLVLALPPGPSTGARWALALYPKKVLHPRRGGGGEALVLDARRPGKGRVAALDLDHSGSVCGYRGRMGTKPRHTGVKPPLRCPMLAQIERGVPLQPGVFLITVVVG